MSFAIYVVVGVAAMSVFPILVCFLIFCTSKVKGRNNRGRVIQPQGTTHVVTHSNGQNNICILNAGPVAPPAYSAMSQPPQYGTTYPPYGYPPSGPGTPLPPGYSQTMPTAPPLPPPAYSSPCPPNLYYPNNPSYVYTSAHPY